MKKILLVKQIYFEAFKNLGNLFLKKYFKAFSWFCFAMFIIALYALIYRMSTGFAFD